MYVTVFIYINKIIFAREIVQFVRHLRLNPPTWDLITPYGPLALPEVFPERNEQTKANPEHH